MNARILAIVALLALGLPAIYWLTTSDEQPSPLSGPDAPSGSEPGQIDAMPAPEVALETPTPMLEPERGGAPARDALEVEQVAERSWPAEQTRWLDLRLIAPDGTPPDETVQVLALSKECDYSDVYGKKGPAVQLAALAAPLSIEGVLGATAIETDGSGRIGLSPDTDEVWLAVCGLYVYSLEVTHIELDSATDPIELRPVLGARISGHLLAPDGQPDADLTQIEVELDWSINAALQLGTASKRDLKLEVLPDTQGRFEFRGVPVGKPQTVSTSDSSPMARVFHQDLKAEPGEHIQIDIQLMTGGTVRGRIIDETGAPIAAAKVNAVGRELLGNPTASLRKTDTDQDGNFELPGVSPGKVWLRLAHDDFQVLLTSPFELADGEVREHGELTLIQGPMVSGTVRFPDGSTAVNAKVSVQPDLSENLAGSQMDPRIYIGAGNSDSTDEDGAFRIRGLGDGPWILNAALEVEDADGARTLGNWHASQGKVRAPSEDLQLTLEEPITVTGMVVNGQQQPMTNFSVRGERAGSQWYMPPSDTREQTFESEDGRFTMLGLRSGDWTFTSIAADHARSEELPLSLPSAEQLNFTLLRPVRLAGTVVDPEGRLVAGAEVSKELEGTEVIEAMQGRGDWAVATSDERGVFALEGLAPGAGSVLAKKDGFAPSAAISYELSEGQEKVDLVLTLRRGGTITGEIYDKEGKPSAGCLVVLQMPTLAERRFANASADGTFEEHGLTPGTWQVQAFPGIASLQSDSGEALDQATLLAALKMTAVELKDEAEEHVVLGAPPEDPVQVHGTVTLDREPVESAIISFVAAGGGGLEMLKIVEVDDDGTYTVQLDEPGDYLVTVQATGTPGRQNSLEYRRTIPSGDDFELHFELPLGRVTGRVNGPDGEPLAGARVSLTQQGGMVFGTVFGGQYTETATDDDGEYEITFLRPGRYAVGAGGAALGGLLGQGSEFGRQVKTIEVDENEWIRGLDFELVEPGSLRGTVRDAAGALVSDAAIFVRDEGGQLLELFSLSQTNASGRFEYTGLTPGDYTISARSTTLASASNTKVRVRPGEFTDTTVLVEPGTMLLVTLTDKTGADLRSHVSVLDSEDREMNGMLSLARIMEQFSGGLDNTVQKVGPLPPGSYRVRAVAEDGRSTVRPVHLTGKPERKVRLRLK